MGRLDLGEVVGFEISGVGNFLGDLLATNDKVTRDGIVVVGAGYDHAGESVLASKFKTGEETANEVVGHEDKSQLVVVFVVDAPDAEALRIYRKHDVRSTSDGFKKLQTLTKVLPEPLHGNIGVVVAVLALPVIQLKVAGGKQVQLGLGLGCRLGFFSRLLLLLGSLLLRLFLLFLLLLLGRSVLQGSLAEDNVTKSFLEVLLVDDGEVVTGDVLVLVAEFLVKDELVGPYKRGDKADIGQGNVLTNEVGLGQQDLVEGIHGTLDSLNGGINVGLHVGHETHQGVQPTSNVSVDFVLGEKDPLHDKCLLNSIRAQKRGVFLLSSGIVGDGTGLEEIDAGAGEDRDLAQGELSQEFGSLVLGKIEAFDVDRDTAVGSLEYSRTMTISIFSQWHANISPLTAILARATRGLSGYDLIV